MEGVNNSRERAVQYETPIIISRGSNKDNPFAEDEGVKKDSLFNDIISALIMGGFIFFFFYAFIKTAKIWDRDEEMISEFEKGSTLWCKPGYEFTSEVRIYKSEGWEYVAHQEMFYNDKLGVTARFSTKLCR